MAACAQHVPVCPHPPRCRLTPGVTEPDQLPPRGRSGRRAARPRLQLTCGGPWEPAGCGRLEVGGRLPRGLTKTQASAERCLGCPGPRWCWTAPMAEAADAGGGSVPGPQFRGAAGRVGFPPSACCRCLVRVLACSSPCMRLCPHCPFRGHSRAGPGPAFSAPTCSHLPR